MAKVSSNHNQVIEGISRFILKDTRRRLHIGWNYVMDNSPVYRGRFLNAWNISSFRPVYKTITEGGSKDFPLPPPPEPLIPNFSHKRVYLTNGQPYASLIEFGWSDQAPTGVLGEAVKRMARA